MREGPIRLVSVSIIAFWSILSLQKAALMEPPEDAGGLEEQREQGEGCRQGSCGGGQQYEDHPRWKNFGQSPKTGISPADWQEVGHGSVGFTDVDVVETISGKYPLVHFVHLQSGLHLGETKG
jgi:hypothetical protein